MDGDSKSGLSLTERAAEYVKEMSEKRGLKEAQFYIKLEGGGCSGFKYRYEVEPIYEGEHLEFSSHGVRIYVEKKSYFFLQGSVVDYVTQGIESKFEIQSPLATSACGCGESVGF